MSISLFEHNKIAYESAIEMLSRTGKAAIIHPTGTGKSFIGFKLCEDYPEKTICWLSPSEYIFQTQLENLKKTSKGFIPENISFYTYAKLMNLVQDEMKEICPDYIILDEFHRCGAAMWGQGVKRLLKLSLMFRFWDCPLRQSAIWTIKEICPMSFLMVMSPQPLH